MTCYRNGGLCKENAFRMDLPHEKVREFFPGYGNTFFSKYGVNTEDVRPHRNFLVDRFLYANRKKYVYCNKLYVKNAYGIYQRSESRLSKIVGDYMEDFVKNCRVHASNGNKEFKKLLSFYNGNFTNIIVRIKNALTNNLFEEKLDTNPNLLVFDNGVLDKDGLRSACDNEFVSMDRSCGYDYELSTEKEKELFLRNIRKSFASDEEMIFRLSYVAQALYRSNPSEILLFELGEHSVLRKLDEKVFGKNVYFAQPDLLYERKMKNRDGHDTNLNKCMNKNLIRSEYLNPGGNKRLDTTALLNYYKGVQISTRTHFEEGMSCFKMPPMIISLQKNAEIPYLPGAYCINYEKNNMDILQVNPCVYLNVLRDYVGKVTVPESIKNTTKNLLRGAFPSFFEYHFMETPKSHIMKKDIYKMFISKCGEVKPKVFDAMVRRFGLEISSSQVGYRIFQNRVSDRKFKGTVIKNITFK
eukprot:g2150.t1